MLHGLPQSQAQRIETAREAGPFLSITEFTGRSGISAKLAERLARADAFGSLKLNRRKSLWQALAQDGRTLPLFDGVSGGEQSIELPAMSGQEEVMNDYRTVGLSLKAHPVSFYRRQLDELAVVPAAQLASMRDGQFVRVAGIVLVRQRPGTAKGITFVTLEDETGVVNLIIRIDVWERFYNVARMAAAYMASGRLQNQQGVIHVLVSRLENMKDEINQLRSKSRDFQ
jgi:error-prone DNA polymerase